MQNEQKASPSRKINPDFIIVGAPKCGTTSLYNYLQQHPRVFMPEIKEPRFFCDYPVADFEFGTKQFHPEIVTSPNDYAALFSSAQDSQITGEASTDYLSCEGSAARICAWNSRTKIIIMLRDPIERAYSEYKHSFVSKFQQDSFWESLQQETLRIEERFDPIFHHVRRSLYARAVEEYINQFGRDQVMTILYEEFSTSTKAVVDSAMTFLGLDPIHIDVSQKHNTYTLQDTHKKAIPDKLYWISRLIGIGNTRRLLGLPRSDEGARGALSRRQYNHLRSTFRSDVKKLSTIIKRDLDHWLESY